MTTVLDKNIYNLAVQGTFDDCQNIVKDLFNDHVFRDAMHLGSVNSINWARILAQIVYYFYAAFRVQQATGCARVRFSVPTGNFGNIFAGYVAQKMGAPIEKLIIATNANDILTRYFMTGVYSLGDVATTLSPSMDIQNASNFERYLYDLAGQDTLILRRWMETFKTTGVLKPNVTPHACLIAGRVDTDETLSTIRSYWKRYGYLLDPHTAVGVAVGQRNMNPQTPMICLATAHSAKFADAIRLATGADIAHHPLLDALSSMPTRMKIVPPCKESIASIMRAVVDAR